MNYHTNKSSSFGSEMTEFMKYLVAFFIVGLSGCTPGVEHAHDSAGQDSSNILLYNEVMDIHDEVMPRMEDLYNIKKDIEERLKDTKGLAAGQKEKLQKKLAQVDSVSKLMMTWMHEFNPPPDSADKAQTQAYLKSELERIKIVKQAMLKTIADSSTSN
jgi:hypothetical protein